ncbi:uncharacterized protein NECHADRAFT_83127 [Fusarium vanettenii 77-13-4]|uniref:Uncharacterized protein n=1 Tax=Fusarium vanettenii (strain ATCC MYA-4622 / CBS 123669 / FGSC 9596 / NRRL 45880 / 77-13-4) TaxID=660122 RepID=C7ZB12_FUSV7|nr:uncharacterized protein NECHADRAFT_83127 [Fusarium vanettenii 77-13-4]EEU38829.1 predicted protein [Fusarium vanettenii 77-13-4]
MDAPAAPPTKKPPLAPTVDMELLVLEELDACRRVADDRDRAHDIEDAFPETDSGGCSKVLVQERRLKLSIHACISTKAFIELKSNLAMGREIAQKCQPLTTAARPVPHGGLFAPN